MTHRSAAKEKDEIKKVRRNYKGSLFCFMITIRNGLISRDYIKQLALHVNSWHHLEDRRFDFTLTFTDVVYKLELKLEFAMENKTFSNCNCYYVQSNTC